MEKNISNQIRWNKMAEWYQQQIEKSSVQGMVTCAAMTNLYDSDKVLEVACGPGFHTEILATSFIKKGAILVSCDISQEMIKKLSQKQQESDYIKVPGNKWIVNPSDEFCHFNQDEFDNAQLCEIDKMAKEQQPFNKLVYSCTANNEYLPFHSNYFNSYIASLSMMLVGDHINMLKESFRVLQPDGRACFTIWSDPKDNQQFSIVQQALSLFHLKNKQIKKLEPQKSNFHLHHNLAQLKEEIKQIGFVGLKVFKQPNNVYYKDGEDYVKKFEFNINGAISYLDEEHQKEVKESIKNLYDLQSGTETDELNTWSTWVILTTKPLMSQQ